METIGHYPSTTDMAELMQVSEIYNLLKDFLCSSMIAITS